MKRARYVSRLIILILLSALMHLPQVQAIIPQEQTISITDTRDDKFITEAGIGIDTYLCHITDPTMDITSFLVFRELEINWWEPLHNATLRFRTTVSQDFDADSSVTIYGMKVSNLQNEGVLSTGFVLSVPLTSAYVNVNTSQFYGQQWHEVDVTSIVQELKSSTHWDGHGRSADETGDDVGFIIYGAEGHDTRWFIDYYYGTPSLATQLVLHWNHEVAPPSGYEDADFVETYGDNYTIWYMPGELAVMDYVFVEWANGYNVLKYDDVNGTGPFLIDSGDCKGGSLRRLIHTSNGTIYTTYMLKATAWWQINVIKSIDNGINWIDTVKISTLPGMDTQNQEYPSMAVDSKDYLHVVWRGIISGEQDVYYVNYTDSWSTPLNISTLPCESLQSFPTIAIDSYDNLHVSWYGRSTDLLTVNQIFYVNYTDSWSTPLRLSTYTDMDLFSQSNPYMAINSESGVHITWSGRAEGYTNYQIWHINKTTTSPWGPITRISTLEGMDVQPQQVPSIAVNSDGFPHIVWTGKPPSPDQIYENHYDGTDWVGPVDISTEAVHNNNANTYPVISIDSNDTRYVLWITIGDMWLVKYMDGWLTPTIAQNGPPTVSAPSIRFPLIDAPGYYFITDENGTVLVEDLDSLQDAEDWIDGYDPDPEDPDPGGQWSEGPGGPTGPFTRFRFRLYLLILGFGCLFGPILFFSWRRPSLYYLFCGAIIMLIGIGLLLSIGQV